DVWGAARVRKLTEHHQEWATATRRSQHLVGERVEHGKYPPPSSTDRRCTRRAKWVAVRDAAPVDVGRDKMFLRSEQSVERRRCDIGAGRHRVDTRRTDALPIEQLGSDSENVLAGIRGAAASSDVG